MISVLMLRVTSGRSGERRWEPQMCFGQNPQFSQSADLGPLFFVPGTALADGWHPPPPRALLSPTRSGAELGWWWWSLQFMDVNTSPSFSFSYLSLAGTHIIHRGVCEGFLNERSNIFLYSTNIKGVLCSTRKGFFRLEAQHLPWCKEPLWRGTAHRHGAQ